MNGHYEISGDIVALTCGCCRNKTFLVVQDDPAHMAHLDCTVCCATLGEISFAGEE